MSAARLNTLINQRKEVGEIVAINPLKRGESGRAVAVEYVGTNGTYVAKGASVNRRLLGGLRSALWMVQPEGIGPGEGPEKWVFTGGGFGHGVGLCQYGAIGMAKAGKTYAAILKQYYRNTVLKRVW